MQELPSEHERSTAALGYLLFPLAITVLVDAGPQRRSAWARAHARHATLFGAASLIFLITISAVPLMLVMTGGYATSAILTMYSISFVVDLIALTAVLWYAVGAARGAARGEVSKR